MTFDGVIGRHLRSMFGHDDGSADLIKIYAWLGGALFNHLEYFSVVHNKVPFDATSYGVGFAGILTAMSAAFGIRAYSKSKWCPDDPPQTGNINQT
jgi:hypothetical protein